MKEIWKTTKQSKYYMVSNYGRVRTIDRVVRIGNHERLLKGRILKLKPQPNGYVKTSIQDKKAGIREDISVHILVAEAFIPNPDNKPIVHHGDHNRSNNRYDNLEWQTYEFNNKEAWESGNQQINSGNFKKGQSSVRRKLVKCSNGLIFESSYYAAEWINKTQFNNTHNIKSIAANIRNQISGRRATAYKFTWKHIT